MSLFIHDELADGGGGGTAVEVVYHLHTAAPSDGGGDALHACSAGVCAMQEGKDEEENEDDCDGINRAKIAQNRRRILVEST